MGNDSLSLVRLGSLLDIYVEMCPIIIYHYLLFILTVNVRRSYA